MTETPRGHAPEVLRRQLRSALRSAREAADMTQREVAEQLDWHTSKIIRIESGSVRVTVVDVKALLALYGVSDSDEVLRLTTLARSAVGSKSWTQYKQVYSKEALTVFGMEGAASLIYKYEPTLVPGLLQTEQYARALLEGVGHSRTDVDLRVAARMERQEILESDYRPEMHFVIGEAAVSHAIGDAGVMRSQIEHLRNLNESADLDIQVLPFSAGSHPHIGAAFTIFQFDLEISPDILYIENGFSEMMYKDDAAMIERFLTDFLLLQDRCPSKHETSVNLSEIATSRFPVSPAREA
jgi:transcriptional regulator with XRE-family HTH domain